METIGKVSASENQPTTVDDFNFWIKDDIIVRPFDIIKVDHYKGSYTYGVIEEIKHITDSAGHLTNYISSDFGDTDNQPLTERLGLTYAKCRVLSNHNPNGEDEQIYMPIKDGNKVYFCNEEEIIEALGLKDIENKIPAGFLEMSNGTTVPVFLNREFLLGPEGAHINISGISGLATKTSYAMFLLQAIQQKVEDVAIININVKSDDLLRLDEPNIKQTKQQKEEYSKCDLECKPFTNVKYFYPYTKKEDRQYSNTYLDKETLRNQHNSDKAFNYIYTYEDTCEDANSNNLDLLFSNIDDPQQTIDSILNEISENREFQGLTWNSFKEAIGEYTQKGHNKSKDISVQSWRRFKRLIRKSISNEIFQESRGSSDKRQIDLKEKVKNIDRNEVYTIDIAKLNEQLQCFVFGDIVRAVYDLKLGETDRNEEEIPSRIVIFVDELNKYASSSAPKNSPILNNILEITERGRSIGIALFSAQQFKSAIHDRAKGNCSTNAYGRTNAIEISKPDYKFIPKVFTNMMTRLGKGDLILEHPIFRSLLKINFPFPSYKQNNE